MDAQTLRLRNNFILLKNGGKDFDSIINEMEGVSIKKLKAWEKSFNEELQIIKNTNPFKFNSLPELVSQDYDNNTKLQTFISEIDKNERYVHSVNIVYNTSFQDDMMMVLYRVSNLDPKHFNSNSKYKNLKEQFELSKQAYKLLDEQLINIEINEDYFITGRSIENFGSTKVQPSHFTFPLSIRDLELIQLLAKGLLYKEIAESMNITTGTVKQHIHRIYEKLEVTNKSDAFKKLESSNLFSKIEIRDQNKLFEVKEAVQFYVDYFLPTLDINSNSGNFFDYKNYNYEVGANVLPIALMDIKIANFQGIKDLNVSSLKVDSQWIFITGENGFGKTSFLQALTIGLFGTKDQNNDLIFNYNYANIKVRYKRVNRSLKNNTYNNKIIQLKNLVCYGPNRLNIQSGFTNVDEVNALTVTQSLFSTQSTLLNIENRLIQWNLSKDNRFDYVVKIFKKLIPYLADVSLIQDNSNAFKIVYIEKEIGTNKKYNHVELTQLASGFRSLIGMVGDIIIRFYLNQPEIENPSDFTGIVIIDEFDLHLHPKLQMDLPSKLSEIFPLVQFIVSTHSAIPLLGAPKNSTIIKVNRNKAEGITAEVLDIDITKLTPNIILTSPIFDMDTITSKSKQTIQDVRTEDDYEAMQKSDNIDKLLEEKEKEGKKYPDSLFV